MADIKAMLIAWNAGERISAIEHMLGYARPMMPHDAQVYGATSREQPSLLAMSHCGTRGDHPIRLNTPAVAVELSRSVSL